MPSSGKEKLSITSWAAEDRPREKLLQRGRDALSNSELLAILLGSGNTEETAVDLAKRILADVENNLNALGTLSLQQLQQYKGIGEAKAIGIAAALELGRRRATHDMPVKPKITCSKDSYLLLYPMVSDLPVENFVALYLNRNNQLIGSGVISKGGVHATVVDSRSVFLRAIELMASHIVLCHNHPSGNLDPSNSDIQLTRKIVEGAKLLDLVILDHIIIAGNRYFSFADEGLMS